MTDSELKPTESTPESIAPPTAPSDASVEPPKDAPAEAPQEAPPATPADTPLAERSPTAAKPEASIPGPVAEAREPAPETVASTPEPEVAVRGLHWGTGRRKSAVARVRIQSGSGKFLVNKREVEAYFSQLHDQMDVRAPMALIGVGRNWDVLVNVHGGGVSGQAGAIRLGLARALVKAYSQHEPALRNAGFLTRDARRVERKKYGRRKARRRFQFSKR